MGRIAQGCATRGSQRWLQEYVNGRREELDAVVGLGPLEWLSPLAEDDFAEYRDGAFLTRLGVELERRRLASFWPRGGPVWDGLARTAAGACVLVEAKAHVSELASSCVASAPASLATIRAAFRETQRGLGVAGDADWCGGYYQYANRLAHAYLLNELNRVPAELVFLYCVGDADVHGPAAEREWRDSIEIVHRRLAVERLPAYVHEVFLDVGDCGRTGRRAPRGRASQLAEKLPDSGATP